MTRPTSPDSLKKVFIKTYGCQMNVYDSERMADALSGAGYEQTTNADHADLVVLNTCHIREKATEKIYSELGRYKARKARHPGFRIAVAGCVAQAEGEEIVRRQPMVDLVIGPQAYHRLPDLLGRSGTQIDTSFPVESKFEKLPGRPAGPKIRVGVFDGSGRLRQVLHFLCCAVHARRRIESAGEFNCR